MANYKNCWDAIIVGAGLGGLSCAATLAKNGLKVLLLERHTMVGGYATQFARKAGKDIEYNLDLSLQLCMGLREGGVFRSVLEEIGVFSDLDIKELDTVGNVKFPDFEFKIPHGISPFRERLIELAPEEKEGIEKLLDTMKGLYEETSAIMENPPGELAPEEFAAKYPLTAKYMTVSSEDLLAEHVQNPKIAAVLNFLTTAFGLPPSRVSGFVYMSVIYGLVFDGTAYIQGGGYALSRALRDSILKHGGDVFVGNEVEQILVENGKCEGVRTKKGDIFKAPFIVCNAPAPVVFEKMIDPSLVDTDYLKQIQTAEISCSTIVGMFGLKGTPDEIGFTEDVTSIRSYDLNNEFDKLMAEDYENGQFALFNNTVVNPGDTPEGRSSLQLLINADGKHWCGLDKEAYKEKKAKVTEVLIDRVAELIPDVRDRLELVVVATPHTHERYTSNPNGSVFAYAMSTTGHSVFRPCPDTPVPGLFLAGAWTSYGPGYLAVVLSGIDTARMILEKK